MTKKRPWIKMVNKRGTCLARCKDPAKAAFYLVDLQYNTGFRVFPNAVADRLFIDGTEYNPPVFVGLMPRGISVYQWSIKNEDLAEAQQRLEYLLDIHEAFYG